MIRRGNFGVQQGLLSLNNQRSVLIYSICVVRVLKSGCEAAPEHKQIGIRLKTVLNFLYEESSAEPAVIY